MLKEYSEVQIDFLGDITCDRPMLKAAKSENGKYNFDKSFENIREILSSADCVIGNLETVFAGEKIEYNPGKFSYNSPDELCKTIANITDKKLILTTANNHSLDCGKLGVSRTLHLMHQYGISSTGTYEPETKKRYHVEELGGIRFGIVSFTACMNQRENGLSHSKSEMAMVNSLTNVNYFSLKKVVKVIGKNILKLVRKNKGEKNNIAPLIKPRKDDYDIPKRDIPMIYQAIEILEAAKKECDFVILCVHSGGQFNEAPGKYTKKLIEKLDAYADLIVCNHPHVIQKIESKNNKLVAYSLGSLNMSPSADYVNFEFLPQYSIVLSVKIRKDFITGNININNISTRFVKSIEDKNSYLYIYDCCKLLKYCQDEERIKLEKDLKILHDRIEMDF